MRKLSLLLCLMMQLLPISAQRYTGWGRGLDGDGGLFFVTGDDAISGIFMLIGCIAIAFICYKIAKIIDKNEESKGIRHLVVRILYIIGCIATIAAIGFAFALWWIVLIVILLWAIGGDLYEKMKEEHSIAISHKTTERKEADSSTPQVKQNKNNYLYNNNENYSVTEEVKIKNRETVFNKRWELPFFMTPLSSFIAIHGYMSIEECVNNMDGEYEKLCMFTNIHGDKTFVAFSPYLGEFTLEDIRKEKDELYVNKIKEGCYFLCTKETERYRKEHNNEFCYFSAEHELEELLTALNIKHDFESYTFSFEE